ncbi:MAG: protein kinase [Gemmataceae bacterium]|nr:protein kinase [Gemmataceae bacterium]MCI0742379.1 protein kinase [Gemmataceae bacterium]
MNTASNAPPDTAELPDDPRLMQAVQEYLAELEAGKRPSRHDILRRYPDLAQPLAQCLDGLDLVHKAALSEPSAPGRPSPLAESAEALAANPLGDFKIVREIGRGGMGIVYEAVQLSLGRRVALKVLPFAATLDAKHLQRFRNEAQAAAQLHHTNIVPVYAVGAERGVHFYAMQLIEGQSLADVIRDMRRQTGRGDDETATDAPHKDSPKRLPRPERNTAAEETVSRDARRTTPQVLRNGEGARSRPGRHPARAEAAALAANRAATARTARVSGFVRRRRPQIDPGATTPDPRFERRHHDRLVPWPL